MSDEPILAAIAKLGDELRGEIVKSRGETAKLVEAVQTSLDAIREELKRIEQLVRLYGR
jgi:hypothetical protein